MSNPSNRREDFSSRLALARQRAGLTQQQVADMIDLHRPSISEMEAGRRRVSSDELARLSEIYGVEIDWLVGRRSPGSSRNEKIELAAREMDKLSGEDLDRVIDLLSSIRDTKS